MHLKIIIKYAINLLVMLIIKLRFGKRVLFTGLGSPSLLWCLEVDSGGFVRLGERFVARRGAKIRVREGGYLTLGDDVFLNDGAIVTVRHSVTIGSRVMLGPYACVFDHDHDYSKPTPWKSFSSKPIIIGKGSWLGAGSMVLKGTKVGCNSIIGANSVVNHSFPDNSLIVGVPGKVIRKLK